MGFEEHVNLEDSQLPSLISYFDPRYLSTQDYDKLVFYENEDYRIFLSIDQTVATSLPRAPFGSFIIKNRFPLGSLRSFEENVISSLKKLNVKTLQVSHPSKIYPLFVEMEALKKVGYEVKHEDVNQHIPLSKDWETSIHKMQLSKLRTLKEEGFEFRKMAKADLEKAHQFLAVCREAQGLQINISWKKLNELISKMTDTYECFGVFRGSKISALCVTVRVTEDIAYYYLPGTSPLFRTHSPMVLLIAGMVAYYRSQGFSSLDLGVSSFNGKPQESLRIFKERMGALETVKPTLIKHIHNG